VGTSPISSRGTLPNSCFEAWDYEQNLQPCPSPFNYPIGLVLKLELLLFSGGLCISYYINYQKEEKKMKRLLIVVSLLCVAVVGCAGANITSTLRQSRLEGGDVQTRCEPCDMRDANELKRIFQGYDGWQVLYISEFTTGNRVGTSGVICFERIRK